MKNKAKIKYIMICLALAPGALFAISPKTSQKMSKQDLDYAQVDLIEAILQADNDRVRSLLKAGVNPNGSLSYGTQKLYPPIIIATLSNNSEAIKLLIAAKANLNAKDETGNSALIYAAKNENMMILQLLIHAGANINQAGKDEDTPLTWAAWRHNNRALKLLVEKGAHLDAINRYGHTALISAIIKNNIEGMKLLIDAGAQINLWTSLGTPLHWAIEKNNIEAVQVLINAGANINFDNPLLEAIIRGRSEIIQLFVDAGAYINESTKQAMIVWATSTNNNKLLASLLTLPPEFRSIYMRQTALEAAISHKNIEGLKLLLHAGADVNQTYGNRNMTPLSHAVREENSDAIEVLIKWGALLNFKDGSNNTALDYNIIYLPFWDSAVGNKKIQKLLIAQGAYKPGAFMYYWNRWFR